MRNLFKILGLLWMSHPVYADVTGGVNHAQSQHIHHSLYVAHSKSLQQSKPQLAEVFLQARHLELSSLFGGSDIPNTIKGQSLQLLPFETGPYADTFVRQSNGRAFSWAIDAKYRFTFHELSIQNYFFDSFGVGVGVFQITGFDQTGNVLQFNMPEFENYTYILNIKNTRIMADFDLDFHPIRQHFIPFMEGGIGAANTVISYSSAPISPEMGPTFKLPARSSWNFAYQVGAGVKYVVNPHFTLSLRYLYADIGKIDSSKGGNTTILAAPLTMKLRAQNVLFGLTYSMN